MKYNNWVKSFIVIVFLAATAAGAFAWNNEYETKRKQFQDAATDVRRNRIGSAITKYEKLAQGYWPLSDVCAARVRDLALKNKEMTLVSTWNHAIIKYFPTSRFRPESMLMLVDEYVKTNQPDQALTLLEQYLGEYPDQDQSRAQYILGELYLKVGRSQDAANAFSRAAWWYSNQYSTQAQAKYYELKRTGVEGILPTEAELWEKIGENLKKQWYLMAGEYANRFVLFYPDSPRAFQARLIYIDSLIARRNQPQAQRETDVLAKLAKTDDQKIAVELRRLNCQKNVDPQQKRAALRTAATQKTGTLSRFDGRLGLFFLEWEQGNWKEAAQWGNLVVLDHLAELFNPEEVIYQTGLAFYLAGDFRTAADYWRKWAAAYPTHPDLDRTQYWLGRALENAGQSRAALAAYHACFNQWQGTYYGLAAEARMLALGVPRRDLSLLPYTNRPALEGVVELQKGWEQVNGGGNLKTEGACAAIDEYIRIAPPDFANTFRTLRELLILGEYEEAEAQLDFIKSRVMQTPEGPYFLSVAYALAGDNLQSILIAYESEKMVRDGKLADPNALSTRRRFPLLYQDLVFQTAKKHGVEPFTVLGMIKQESAFQIQAQSSVGARGLMQIMPGTGTDIARRRKLHNFRPTHLYKPEVSVDYGAWFLADLLKRFNNDLVAALAGYNAGPGRPAQWWPRFAGRSYEELIELMPLRETKGYVKAILRNREMYLRLYQDSPEDKKPRETSFMLLTEKIKPLP